MLRAACIAFLAILAARPGSAQDAPRMLEPGGMQQDLFELSDYLQRFHAGLARYAEPGEIDAAFGEALESVAEPRDVLSFYRLVSELVARVRCGHTGVVMKPADQAAAEARKGLVPIEIALRGERAWIVRALVAEPALAPGTELVSVDGASIGDIRGAAFARLRGDGFGETGKERGLERDFATMFALLVDDAERFPSGYALGLAGRAEPLRVAGLAPGEYARLRTAPPPDSPVVELELRADARAAILHVRVFGDGAPPEPPFLDELEASFRVLREQKIERLVLDLRGNGGGRDMYGATLVSYLASRPFGYFERIEVTPDYADDSVEIVERDGRRLMMSHDGLAEQAPAELAFRGRTCVLIDGDTFSTAADVASVAHANDFARFVGEETGGGYAGNTSGDTGGIVLPHSGFAVRVPLWSYFTAGVARERVGRGVLPEREVRPTIEDVLAGRDPALAAALELIGGG